MLYSELLKLWDESVQAMDSQDWQGALEKLQQVQEPTSRILFNTASANLALGRLDTALKFLDLTLTKDERFAVGFFQRAAVNMKLERLEDALSDCIWAQKHMRKNAVIDYKQLGLRFKLCSWQVLHNAAAVYCRMDQWEQAKEVLLAFLQQRSTGGGGHLEAALDSIRRGELLTPLMVPESLVFRPRKQEIEQLQKKDFLGKPKVISSTIPNDDFGGFEPLRQQRPGFYEPKVDGAQESRYMRVRTPYMARAPEQLTVPGGVVVFLFGEEDRDGMINVIHDGQRGLLPVSLLEPTEVNTPKAKKSVPNGIPLPPALQPPGRPEARQGPAAPPRDPPPPSSTTSAHAPPSSTPKHAANTGPEKHSGSSEDGSVVVKVHYTYTVAVTVPLNTPYHELKQCVAQKLGRPASELCLRHKQRGSHLLSPLSGEPGCTAQDLAVAGRATLWCQVSFSTNSVPARLPQPCSVHHLVESYLDIAAVPRRSFFELLATFATNELERDKLVEFSSAAGQEELNSYCSRPRRTALEVLTDFPHTTAELKVDYLLDLFPEIQPRSFSIASSLKAHPHRLQILVAVVRYKTKLHKSRRGLCSTWLASLDPTKEEVCIPLWVKTGSLRFPADSDTPVIMVGPGTGVAPFRSALQERVSEGKTANILFFGCRSESKDFYFRSEWEHLVEAGHLTLFTAFSRDQEEKVYVQHRVKENAALLWDLISQRNAYFYIAGNAKQMPASVCDSLKGLFQQEGGVSADAAAQMLAVMEKTGRLQSETWS